MIVLFVFVAPWLMVEFIAPAFGLPEHDYWTWFAVALALGLLAGCRDIDITVRK